MKIGILTFYLADNYGALFQALASKYYLETMGHEVYIINHLNRTKIHTNYFLKSSSRLNNLKFFVKQMIRYPFLRKKYKLFSNFVEEYLTPYNGKWKYEPNDFDCFYVGSDQIWNPLYENEYIPVFFCQFPGANNKRCISYSASMGINYIPQDLYSTLILYLKKFVAISVREETAKRLISPLVDIPVEVTIDPTFLLTKEQWLNLFPFSKQKKLEPYIVSFEVRHSELTDKLANIISQHYGYKIIKISPVINLNDKKTYRTLNPSDFISTIANAKFVITTSFHGTAFSLICRVPFYSIETNANDNRIKDLLSSCDANDRMINSIPKEINNQLDWDTISQKLNIYINKSKRYLNKSLQIGN